MGFVGFLRFSLLCLDFLAWPTFALIYPLWASIRAIETSSKYHMKKLVIYWTIFSLISLFEIFFVRFIRWVPFWPYIKLVSVFWLVMPRFDGACIAYQHLVHPFLSFSLQDIMNCFSIPKEKPYNEDSFLASAETFLEENGPEALEKLIASKAKSKEPILGDDDAMEVVKRVEPAEKNVTSEEQLPKLDLVEIENKEIAAPEEAQRVTTPAEIKEKVPIEILALKKVQSEWTCAVCQLATQSEATLNSHLQGRRHRSKCEKLKTSAQTLNDSKKSAAAKTNPKISVPREKSIVQNTIEKPTCQPMQGKGQPKKKEMNALVQQQQQKQQQKQQKQQQPRFWCGICNISCPGKIDLDCHLKGKKHLLNLQSIS